MVALCLIALDSPFVREREGQHDELQLMNYSYTQISQYLTCPRRYRHRYLDGWQEKDVRAAMLFGRCFEQAVVPLFRHEDPAAVLFEQWTPCKDLQLSLLTGSSPRQLKI